MKVALLKDASQFFEFLITSAEAIADRSQPQSQTCPAAIGVCCTWHITRGGDPFELQQARPLDFGHWSAHKLEAITNYEVRHGEAVSIGVAVDVAYSHLRHGLPLEVVERSIVHARAASNCPSGTRPLGKTSFLTAWKNFASISAVH